MEHMELNFVTMTIIFQNKWSTFILYLFFSFKSLSNTLFYHETAIPRSLNFRIRESIKKVAEQHKVNKIESAISVTLTNLVGRLALYQLN